MMMASNGVPPPADTLYADISSADEPLSSPDSAPLYDNSGATTPMSDLPSPTASEIVQDEEEREKLSNELIEVESDVVALRQTLRSKEMRAKEIRRKLGMTPMHRIKEDVSTGWNKLQTSTAYQNTSAKLGEWNEYITTSETYKKTSTKMKEWNTNIVNSPAYSKTKTGLSSAGQKTTAAFSTFGSVVSRKLGEVRDSTAFKSFEDKLSTATANVKNKVARSQSQDSSFEDVLQSTANAEAKNDSSPSAAGKPTEPPLPEEKVPL